MGWTSLQEDIETRASELDHLQSTLGPIPTSRSDVELAATIAACRTLLGRITKVAEALSKPDAEVAVRLVRAEGRVRDLEQQLRELRDYSKLAASGTMAARDVSAKRNVALANENDELRKRIEALKLARAADRRRMKEQVAAARRTATLIWGPKPAITPKSHKKKRGAKSIAPKLGGKSVRESTVPPPIKVKSKATPTQAGLL